MYLTSINWDEKNGVCLMHGLPQLPCPQCLATDDPDMEYRATTAEMVIGFTVDETVREFERLENEAIS